jgi:hypothetical protein
MERCQRQSRDGARHHEMSEQDVIEPNGESLHANFNAHVEESFHFVNVPSKPWAQRPSMQASLPNDRARSSSWVNGAHLRLATLSDETHEKNSSA